MVHTATPPDFGVLLYALDGDDADAFLICCRAVTLTESPDYEITFLQLDDESSGDGSATQTVLPERRRTQRV